MRTKFRIQSMSAMLKRWWGRLENRWIATESGGDETATRPDVPAVRGTRPTTRRRRRLVTNETAATGGVMYADEVSGDETGNETSGPGDKTAATGGVMYMDEGELEFDGDEMAALEGQRLVAEFNCGIY